jgi:ABC-2 type transport system ATP-binding protein
MAIEFQHVTKRFGAVTAVNDVSVTFGGDRIYGLLGNNGAGKSTREHFDGRICPVGGDRTVAGAPVTGDEDLGKLFLVGEQKLFPRLGSRRAFDAAALFYRI